MKNQMKKRLLKSLQETINSWAVEEGKRQCAWCTLTLDEHLQENLGHEWISQEMDILLNKGVIKFSKKPINWKIKIK